MNVTNSLAASKILVADDDTFHNQVVARFLRSAGYTKIFLCEDPREVEKLEIENQFDLVLLDLDMPHLSGLDVIGILRDCQRADEHLPIIVFTGHSKREVRIDALARGADDFLTKPIDPLEAKHRIQNLLSSRLLHNLNRAERQRNEEILTSIIPRQIVARMKAGETRIADYIEHASILFVDLEGFTAFSARNAPSVVVDFLDSLFSLFDRLTEKHGLEKIKTIGDAYMVLGGLVPDDRGHVNRIAQLALDMIANAPLLKVPGAHQVQFRIGIHCGPIIAGVLGGARSVFDVWGDTVNTASRFESSSSPGRVNVSSEFAKLVDGKFELEPRGAIWLAGKGEMNAYFLGPQRGESRALDIERSAPQRSF